MTAAFSTQCPASSSATRATSMPATRSPPRSDCADRLSSLLSGGNREQSRVRVERRLAEVILAYCYQIGWYSAVFSDRRARNIPSREIAFITPYPSIASAGAEGSMRSRRASLADNPSGVVASTRTYCRESVTVRTPSPTCRWRSIHRRSLFRTVFPPHLPSVTPARRSAVVVKTVNDCAGRPRCSARRHFRHSIFLYEGGNTPALISVTTIDGCSPNTVRPTDSFDGLLAPAVAPSTASAVRVGADRRLRDVRQKPLVIRLIEIFRASSRRTAGAARRVEIAAIVHAFHLLSPAFPQSREPECRTAARAGAPAPPSCAHGTGNLPRRARVRDATASVVPANTSNHFMSVPGSTKNCISPSLFEFARPEK